MSTATIRMPSPPIVPTRRPTTAILRTGAVLSLMSPLPLRGYDYETLRPRSPAPQLVPSLSAPSAPAAAATQVVAVPPALETPAPAQTATAPEAGPVPEAGASAASPVQLYTPSPETLEFLQTHKQINFDTQLVEVRTTGKVDADAFHRAAYGTLEEQAVPNVRVVQRSDNRAILGHVGGSVSMKYTPCQNAYLVESLHRAGMFDKMDAVRVDALKGGALVVIAMETKDAALMYETPMGPARFRMGFWNGHTGNHTVSVAPMLNLPSGGDVPLFTAEGGLAGQQNIRHTRSVNDTVADLSKAWGNSMKLAAKVSETLKEMGDFKITRQEFDAVLLASMNKTLDGRNVDVAGNTERFKQSLMAHTNNRTPETLLELADAVAAHVDFDRPVRNRKGLSEDYLRTESALVGVGARMKNAVLAEALAFIRPRT